MQIQIPKSIRERLSLSVRSLYLTVFAISLRGHKSRNRMSTALEGLKPLKRVGTCVTMMSRASFAMAIRVAAVSVEVSVGNAYRRIAS